MSLRFSPGADVQHAFVNFSFDFGVALQPEHLIRSVFGILSGKPIHILPGMGAPTAIPMLLPLPDVIAPVPAIRMLAGFFQGSMYGGDIGTILLILSSRAPRRRGPQAS